MPRGHRRGCEAWCRHDPRHTRLSTPLRFPRVTGHGRSFHPSMLALRNWRVRSKLIAVLLIPALAFLVLASINIASSVQNAQQFGQGAKLAGLGGEVTGLVHELQQERDLTIGHMAS